MNHPSTIGQGHYAVPKICNDHNVYILGAGFSRGAGMPLIADFLNTTRDSIDWLESNERQAELAAVARVLELRRQASSAAARLKLNVEDIEELFSLAAVRNDASLTQDVILAICATLNYAAQTQPTEAMLLPVRRPPVETNLATWGSERTWDVQESYSIGRDSFVRARLPVVDAFAGIISGVASQKSQIARDTVITFNYDLCLEGGLRRHAAAYYYPGIDVNANGIGIIKLHGSVNWTEGADAVETHSSYEDIREKEQTPLLIPPTWNKGIHRAFGEVWRSAIAALSEATRVFVIGYSMPTTDTHFKYLLAAGLQDNISLRTFAFVDPASPETITTRASSLFPMHFAQSRIVKHYSATLSRFIRSRGNLEDNLARPPFDGFTS